MLVKESLDSFLGEKEDPNTKVRNRGDVILSAGSKFVKDNADHFPINSSDQARNAWARVNQYDSSPGWYEGDLDSLKKKVKNAVTRKYPDIKINEEKVRKGEDLNPEDVDQDQLEVGKAVEKVEHAPNDEEKAMRIALDHLAEDPEYYTTLVQSGLVDEPEALKLYRELLAGDDA